MYVVAHNIAAMNANRMLGNSSLKKAKNTEKLSSGYNINRAADDAAGLAISEKMRKQIKGLDRASTNSEDGISAVQTAEGALGEVHAMLQRMNELSVQAANGTNSLSDREAIQDEIEQLSTEIDRVAESTKFNEIYLLKGGSGNHLEYVKAHDAGLEGVLVNSGNRATFTVSLQGGQTRMISGVNYNILEGTRTQETSALQTASGTVIASPLDSINVVRHNIDALVSGRSAISATDSISAQWSNTATGDTVTINGTAYELIKNKAYLDENGTRKYHDVFADNSGNEYTVEEIKAKIQDGSTVMLSVNRDTLSNPSATPTSSANNTVTSFYEAPITSDSEPLDTAQSHVIRDYTLDNNISVQDALQRMENALIQANNIGTANNRQTYIADLTAVDSSGTTQHLTGSGMMYDTIVVSSLTEYPDVPTVANNVTINNVSQYTETVPVEVVRINSYDSPVVYDTALTNANRRFLPWDATNNNIGYYNIETDSENGLRFSWTGYDGGSYTSDWVEFNYESAQEIHLKDLLTGWEEADRESFEGLDAVVSYTPNELTTTDDLVNSLSTIRVQPWVTNRASISLYDSSGSVIGTGGNDSVTIRSYSVSLNSWAVIKSERDLDEGEGHYDTNFAEPIGTNSTNLVSRPEQDADGNWSGNWQFKMQFNNIGTVYVTSSAIYYEKYVNSDDDADRDTMDLEMWDSNNGGYGSYYRSGQSSYSINTKDKWWGNTNYYFNSDSNGNIVPAGGYYDMYNREARASKNGMEGLLEALGGIDEDGDGVDDYNTTTHGGILNELDGDYSDLEDGYIRMTFGLTTDPTEFGSSKSVGTMSLTLDVKHADGKDDVQSRIDEVIAKMTSISGMDIYAGDGDTGKAGINDDMYEYDYDTYTYDSKTGTLYNYKSVKRDFTQYNTAADISWFNYTENGKVRQVSDAIDGTKLKDYTFLMEMGQYVVSNNINFDVHAGSEADMTNKIGISIDAMTTAGLGLEGINVADDSGIAATYAIDAISDAIAHVSDQRAYLGAKQNRLEHTISNLDNVVENTTASESRLRDADMASEMVEYSRHNVLEQAGQSVLAQANQQNQGVLSLLQQ